MPNKSQKENSMTKQEKINILKEKLYDINVYSLEYVSLLDQIIVLQYELNSDEDCKYYYKCSARTKHEARCSADECYNEAFGEEPYYKYFNYAI